MPTWMLASRAMQEQRSGVPRGWNDEEESKTSLFNILSLFVFKNKENKQKRIYFNTSSPKPSPAREGLREKTFNLNLLT